MRDSGTATLGMIVAGTFRKEEKHHHHHECHGQHELELDVLDRCANGQGAVRQNGNLNGRGQRTAQLRQEPFDAIDNLDDIGAGLPLDIYDDRRDVVDPRWLIYILDAINHRCHIRQHDRRPIAIRDDERTILLARQQLIIGADLVRLVGPLKLPLGRFDACLLQRRAHILQVDAVR